ncbi:stage II sporulation protein P [Sediminibacillus albus]|uniref:Stage II sporulation protein P n=1 Tax=Sediminibacillus albus TaxID=407036 RepID=A0A1G9CNV9_9BACI|nr:stage II sporulation protein P [Sediminibacillus albus]SDK53144.1 stage II sporulation protein P [Sediminibacillus albus]
MHKTSIKGFLNKTRPWYKNGSMLVLSLTVLFLFIGVLTTIQPAYRLSSNTINDWTRQIKGSSFLYIMGMENKIFEDAYPEDYEPLDTSSLAFQLTTSLKSEDPRSLLGRELPGFQQFDREILVAGEGTDYTNLTVESSAPLEVVLKDREASMPEDKDNDETTDEKVDDSENSSKPSTGERKVVFIYNTHNRESFLPHLPSATTPNEAFHAEVNITKVSDQLKKKLEELGVGTQVDHTDITDILQKNDWDYSADSYRASKPIVEEALAANKDLNYVFDLHRDSMGREITTKTINGKDYAKLMFVLGSENANFEKNLKLANDLHNKLEEKYPGLSRGVEKYGGPGRNGVYNQDVSDNALTIEFGGVDNNMDELYRSAAALAEVFSDYYWDAEKVQANP